MLLTEMIAASGPGNYTFSSLSQHDHAIRLGSSGNENTHRSALALQMRVVQVRPHLLENVIFYG